MIKLLQGVSQMQILPINNNRQTSFQAVNQKYYQWAERDIKKGLGLSGEILTRIEMDVCWKDISPRDAIDTIEAIKKIIPKDYEGIETTLNYIKQFLP